MKRPGQGTQGNTRDPGGTTGADAQGCVGGGGSAAAGATGKTCHYRKLVGHKKGYCKNFANKKKRNVKKRRTTNDVVVTASTGTHVASGASHTEAERKLRAHLTLKPNGIPVYSANRLRRWATTLLSYDFNVEYVNTKDFGQADALCSLIASQL
ncbi:unnamed protein product [Toxocara canis]|uniref:SWIM-type domain-containing protein n=1 Tax=Toxocara canis TaxID=6265 RepID=A0A183UZK8_TOXCA|nr:unnamed protein product [Toxocara canis]